MQSKSLPVDNTVAPEHKSLNFYKEKGYLNRIFKYLDLFNSKKILQKAEEKNLSPYVINTNIAKEKKLMARELLIRANPLYDDKHTQKASDDACSYYALNYIRTRYKQCPHLFQRE